MGRIAWHRPSIAATAGQEQMKVRFTDPAIRDLAEFHTYVSAENPPAADKLLLRIIDLAQNQLALFPNCGRTGRVDGAREPTPVRLLQLQKPLTRLVRRQTAAAAMRPSGL